MAAEEIETSASALAGRSMSNQDNIDVDEM